MVSTLIFSLFRRICKTSEWECTRKVQKYLKKTKCTVISNKQEKVSEEKKAKTHKSGFLSEIHHISHNRKIRYTWHGYACSRKENKSSTFHCHSDGSNPARGRSMNIENKLSNRNRNRKSVLAMKIQEKYKNIKKQEDRKIREKRNYPIESHHSKVIIS